jgi:hypothetical protein
VSPRELCELVREVLTGVCFGVCFDVDGEGRRESVGIYVHAGASDSTIIRKIYALGGAGEDACVLAAEKVRAGAWEEVVPKPEPQAVGL